MNRTDLLARFQESRSEAAFADLVRGYTNLVYSIAKRRVSNDLLAQEVTQIVFIRLAKVVSKIRGEAELVGWLHRTSVHASIDLWRSEVRRRAREEQAVAMQLNQNETAPWNELSPVLDEALNELSDADRQAILLRFFDEKSMRDLGAVFAISEDAAKMRVNRALDRLRNQLTSRGVACSAVGLGGILAERSVEAAPAQFASTLASLKYPLSMGAGAGLIGMLLQGAKVKVIGGIGAAVVIALTTIMFLRSRDGTNAERAVEVPRAAQVTGQSSDQNAQSTEAATQDSGLAEPGRDPDPVKLLQGVAAARQRYSSGSMEFQVWSHHTIRNRIETNLVQLKGLFDGSNLRFEQVGREYSYTLMGDDASEFSDAKMQELNLDREAAAKAGLLKGFESRHVSVYDGSREIDYWENDGESVGTTIREAGHGGLYLFDPRCLGLRTSLGAGATAENCLAYGDAKSIKLVGKEQVEGTPAWHVRVKSKYDELLDFWIDVVRPERVLRHVRGQDEVTSKYDARYGSIPAEVTVAHNRGKPWGQRFVQSNAQLGITVDPVSFTLAGMGMKVGTAVSDNRNSRRIGYWTGTGLSESLPSRKKAVTDAEPAPTLAEMVAILEMDPASPRGFDAATWILFNTPDGPEVEKAAEVVRNEHMQGTNLVSLCQELQRVRHRCSKPLLRAILENNPNPDVQATACFMLATMLKDECKYGQDKKITAESEKLFERVITQFSQVGRQGPALTPRAKAELFELRRLIIGKPAPEIEGKDLDGVTMKLSDYRGKVVVLTFWGACGGCRPEVDNLRKLLDRLGGAPFAVLGVHCDDDGAKARAIVEDSQITWPSFLDGRDGPISKNWNINGWPTVFMVLDRQGVIRYRDVRDGSLGKAVDALLTE